MAQLIQTKQATRLVLEASDFGKLVRGDEIMVGGRHHVHIILADIGFAAMAEILERAMRSGRTPPADWLDAGSDPDAAGAPAGGLGGAAPDLGGLDATAGGDDSDDGDQPQ